MNEELKKYLSENGKKGGQATKQKYGSDYYKKLAEKRWGNRKEEKLSTEDIA